MFQTIKKVLHYTAMIIGFLCIAMIVLGLLTVVIAAFWNEPRLLLMAGVIGFSFYFLLGLDL